MSDDIDGHAPKDDVYRLHAIYEADLENDHPGHPHTTMMMCQSYDGRGSMLYSELTPIISAMRSRAFQPIEEEHEQDDLLENDEPFDNKPLAFPDEE